MLGCPILIVEDDPGSSDVFAPILTSHGYDVRVAVDANAALREMDRRLPAALLVDLHLPLVDGVELIRRIRGGAHAHVPAALMTGDYLIDDSVVEALRAIQVRLYFKPLWEEDLVAIMQALLPAPVEFPAVRGKFLDRPSPH